MNADKLEKLLFAPEIIVVDLVASALAALRLALLVEHPLLADDLAAPDDPPVRRKARRLLWTADQLRLALHQYRRAVRSVLREAEQPDLPF